MISQEHIIISVSRDTASLNTYAKIIYDYTDTQFEEFLNNTSYAQKCSAAEKNDYIKESSL